MAALENGKLRYAEDPGLSLLFLVACCGFCPFACITTKQMIGFFTNELSRISKAACYTLEFQAR